ncbi:hypothetical protein, partial [Dermacoccus nishinomiyaensis]
GELSLATRSGQLLNRNPSGSWASIPALAVISRTWLQMKHQPGRTVVYLPDLRSWIEAGFSLPVPALSG